MIYTSLLKKKGLENVKTDKILPINTPDTSMSLPTSWILQI